jgi:endonuclease YncB( thermonuclease family)
MKWMLVIMAALMPGLAFGQEISGRGSAVDGDTIDMAGVAIRLHGIDAPEFKQTCERGGASWSCGQDAATRLKGLVAGRELRCEQRDTDDYGRIVATCRAGQVDFSQAMVDAGLAIALVHFTDKYVASEERARQSGIGIWGGEFQRPSEYRAANPVAKRRSPPTGIARQSFAAPRPSGVYYRNCTDARAAGAAPLYRGQPGYRPEMDGDGDGIACEPYRGR